MVEDFSPEDYDLFPPPPRRPIKSSEVDKAPSRIQVNSEESDFLVRGIKKRKLCGDSHGFLFPKIPFRSKMFCP